MSHHEVAVATRPQDIERPLSTVQTATSLIRLQRLYLALNLLGRAYAIHGWLWPPSLVCCPYQIYRKEGLGKPRISNHPMTIN